MICTHHVNQMSHFWKFFNIEDTMLKIHNNKTWYNFFISSMERIRSIMLLSCTCTLITHDLCCPWEIKCHILEILQIQKKPYKYAITKHLITFISSAKKLRSSLWCKYPRQGHIYHQQKYDFMAAVGFLWWILVCHSFIHWIACKLSCVYLHSRTYSVHPFFPLLSLMRNFFVKRWSGFTTWRGVDTLFGF